MIAISSLRPFADSESYAQLQIQANQSWLPVFDEIIYVCKTGEDALRHPQTTFILDDRPFIPIKYLAELAASPPSPRIPVAIINSDIVVTSKLRDLGRRLLTEEVNVITSRRWTFYGGQLDQIKLLPGDHGLDIFVTLQPYWKAVAELIPQQYCLGLPGWDEWLLRAFTCHHPKLTRDFTSHRCILHPFHTERAAKPAIGVEEFNGPPPTVLAL